MIPMPLAAFFLLLFLPARLGAEDAASVTRETVHGVLRGELGADGRVCSFKGVPYAAPPVGELRWKPPQPVVPWDGVRDATRFGPRAMQGRIWDDMFFHDDGPGEDCLYLNLWIPEGHDGGKLPVMVWIHGGGFIAGGTSEPRQNGRNLSQKGVIVVTVGYRMGVFGFLAHPELTRESPHQASGNYGLLDMVAALEWVRDHIGAFGGDPENVTLFGESAGSWAVSALMASPLARGLFHRAIGQSGSMLDPAKQARRLDEAGQAGKQFVERAFGPTTLDALRALPADALLEKAWGDARWDFQPVIDGHFLPAPIGEIYATGAQAPVPLLAGWNLDEAGAGGFLRGSPPTLEHYRARAEEWFGDRADAFLQVYPADTDEAVEQAAADIAGDQFIGFATWKWIEEHARTSAVPIYRYRFDQRLPLPADAPAGAKPKAAHSSEIEYVFRVLVSKNLPWRDEDRQVSEAMATYWTNFAKTGDPNSDGVPHWPSYCDNEKRSVMLLGVPLQLASDPHRDRYEFLDKPVPGEIVFSERHPGRDPSGHYYANFGYNAGDENQWLYGADGGRLAILNPDTGQVRTLIEDPRGAFRDPVVHYDAKKVLFSYRKGGTHHYNLHEIQLDGSGLRQLTSGDWDDVEPSYLPDGGIVFCSSRSMRYVPCWLAPVAILYRCDADGSNIQPLSSGSATENTPSILPDGRILYTRWEYVNRDAISFHHLWTMNPDGTGVAAYYGNMHPGDLYIGARPIPGGNEVVYVNAGYHGSNEHVGRLELLDLQSGPDDPSQVRVLTENGFRDPYPVSSTQILAARGNELVMVPDQGEVRTLWTSEMMVHEPRLIRPRPREPIIPSRIDSSKSTGTLFVQDVHLGRNMGELPPGTIRKLLVMEDLPKPINFHGGGTTPMAHGGKWTLNRILGTVPVEPDGSAHFEVPAGRSIYLASLDENDLSVKQMRSFLTVMPGERASCIGCHENRTTTTMPAGVTLALQREPSQIEPFKHVPEIIDFPRDVQPILDRHCVACHNPDQRDGGVVLTGDRGPTYSLSYYNLLLHRQVRDRAGSRWEGEENLGGRPGGNDAPYQAFSGAAPLMAKLDGSHHDAKLNAKELETLRLWLDSATPYAGTYAAYGTGQIGGWWQNNEPIREMADDWPSTAPAHAAMERRCSICHEKRMPRFVTDQIEISDGHGDFEGWMRAMTRFSRHNIFNLTHPEQSLALKAVLAKSAGGEAEGALPDPQPVPPDWARAPQPFIHPVVFETSDDPDYQAILTHLQAASARLNQIKRFDMPGFQPRYEYLREMKRYGVLPEDFDLQNPAPVDPYVIEEAYWRKFHHQPHPHQP